MLTVGSLFSGIGGFDLGLERSGWNVAWQVENNTFCNQVLQKRWSDVQRYKDIQEVNADCLEPVNLLCGGFPCQDLSVAGDRAGLAGERSGLFFEYIRLVRALRPAHVLIENVPGLLSSQQGKDMGIVIETLSELGYGVAWRSLDSQYFGVPQRRQRVFIVGHLGGPCPSEILFESESLHGNTQESQGEREKTTPRVGESISHALNKGGRNDSNGETFVVAKPLLAHHRRDNDDETFVIQDAQDIGDKKHTGIGIASDNAPMYTLDSVSQHAIFQQNSRSEVRYIAGDGQIAGAVVSEPGVQQQNYLAKGTQVRRLTPLECERLQGFPDDWTDIGSDAQRYKALGNAVTVPVAKWIGQRILQYGNINA